MAGDQPARREKIRKAAIHFAEAIVRNTVDSDSRAKALQNIHKAVSFAHFALDEESDHGRVQYQEVGQVQGQV